MDDEPMWAADHVVALTSGSAITIPKIANEFTIKGNHLTLVKGNQFDGRTKTDPHKHIHEFLEIYDMFKYKNTKNEAIRLMMFPISLTEEAKTWLDELNEGTIETWDKLRTAFISHFFPPTLFDRLLGEIRAFSQHENESLTDAWLRMKEISETVMVTICPKATLSKSSIMLKICSLKLVNSPFPTNFVILEMEEDSNVPLILGRPFLHTVDAVIRVKQKQLNLGVELKRMNSHIDFPIDNTPIQTMIPVSRIDVINDILGEDFDGGPNSSRPK
ncbi:reverse transcriptase domain-containing protein [Tanacetum coccineum]